MAMFLVSGRATGLWVTWVIRNTLLRLKECGLTLMMDDKCDASITANRESPNELDAVEASARAIIKIIDSASVQVSPFYLYYQPDYDYVAVYYLEVTAMNAYRGRFFKETIFTISVVNND
ncbi:unnamed protein product [Tuber aestivum]|uniref:Uncharacterized protein n=1 Tax=Tuber aestivum TaxID=59557 RepID=A0A292PW72_9PEZI|nr:unnamed protein product [Tuber aestivum]